MSHIFLVHPTFRVKAISLHINKIRIISIRNKLLLKKALVFVVVLVFCYYFCPMMKKVSVIILFPIVIQVLIICLLSYGWLSILRTSNKSIVIFYENDAHCALDGYANFAGLRDEVIKADTLHL